MSAPRRNLEITLHRPFRVFGGGAKHHQGSKYSPTSFAEEAIAWNTVRSELVILGTGDSSHKLQSSGPATTKKLAWLKARDQISLSAHTPAMQTI